MPFLPIYCCSNIRLGQFLCSSLLLRVVADSSSVNLFKNRLRNHATSRNTAVNFTTWGSKKQHRKIKLHEIKFGVMDPKIEAELAPLRANVKEQVRDIPYASSLLHYFNFIIKLHGV